MFEAETKGGQTSPEGVRTEVMSVGFFGWLSRARITLISAGITSRRSSIMARRLVPPQAQPRREPLATFSAAAQVFHGVASPGQWVAPKGQRPGWDWLPEHGASPNLRAMPRWVRAWYRLPFVDRFAYEWMWWRGGWLVWVPPDPPDPPQPPPDSGVREPRRPPPRDPNGAAATQLVHGSQRARADQA